MYCLATNKTKDRNYEFGKNVIAPVDTRENNFSVLDRKLQFKR